MSQGRSHSNLGSIGPNGGPLFLTSMMTGAKLTARGISDELISFTVPLTASNSFLRDLKSIISSFFNKKPIMKLK
ncbi:MAG: hypothetical protein V2J25_07210 [Desulfatiglans sp.]|jgi:hypothetical protein|nr:hypothetical protein [Desulfatiglans sp.]